MKKFLRIFRNIVLMIVAMVILFFIVMAIYHHVMLAKEAKDIKISGNLVKVDGFNMNVFVTGIDKNEGISTIVLLSGSGVAAPVYDYKILYSKLIDEHRVVVIEKFGYGNSEISGLSRDVKTMVEEDRKALLKAGESGPYLLMPHSMSALEAIYWAKTYPAEVKAIIGLDMAVPGSYNAENTNTSKISFMKYMTFFGLHRIPGLFYINKDGLSEQETTQLKYLTYRNALSDDVYAECKMVYKNALLVKELGAPDVSILMFTTNLGISHGSENWIKAQDDFAKRSNKYIQIKLDCGHNLHHFKSEYIASEIKTFLGRLK